MASDSLNESVTRVVILIKDSNDLPPIFNQTMYTAHALEELADPLPFKLLQVASTYNSGFFISFFIPKNPVEFIYFQSRSPPPVNQKVRFLILEISFNLEFFFFELA